MLLMITVSYSCQDANITTSSKQQFITDLLAQMNVEEKVGQLNLYTSHWELTGPVPQHGDMKMRYDNIRNGKVGAMLNVTSAAEARAAQRLAVEESRLGIPMMFGYDVIHGFKTMLPIPLAQAASWNPEVATVCNQVAATEAGVSGINWSFGPMIDITRDARWGRMMEGAGEDPYLCSIMAEAWVRGFQGDDLSANNTIAACAKHFAAYGFADGGREYNTVDISLHRLHNIVLPPFLAAANAGSATFMNAFNEISGIPATAHRYLQRDVLKENWGFRGFVVSDWGSIGELMSHGHARDTAHASLLAMNAGSDMDMEARVYETALAGQIETEEVQMQLLDDAVLRILGVKYDLGLFDDPYKYCNEEAEKSKHLSNDHLKVARETARQSIVLLKNDMNILPVSKSQRKIGIIGSLAADKDVPLGSWRGKAISNTAVSLLEGVQDAVENKAEIRYAEGYKLTQGERAFVYELNIVDKDETGFTEAIALAKSSDIVLMAMGEDCFQSGEGRSQTDITLKGSQMALLRKVVAINPNVIVVLMSGRALDLSEVNEIAPAILEVWHLGSQAGHAIADVIFGDYNPSGKLPVCFPRNVGQVPIYYNQKNTGRPATQAHDAGMVFWSHYSDSPNTPLYAFGHGLSYTKFKFSDFKLSKNEFKKGESITASLIVKNIGKMSGKETIQLYIRDHVASVTRPVKELKSFKQISLEPGETEEVEFIIDEALLSFYRQDLSYGSEPGQFSIMVGNSSDQLLVENLTLVQ